MNQQAQKYRSKVRDVPRQLTPTDHRAPPPPPGTIHYHSRASRLSEMLREGKHLNRAKFEEQFQGQIGALREGLDSLHAMAAVHAWTLTSWHDAIPHEANHVLISCFHKSLLNLHVALELTLDGLYGMARPHLRQAFESLMIAKLCATDPTSDIFDKWIDGLDLYFTNGIVRHIDTPDTSQFVETWGLLCRWSHATVYAAQLSMDLHTTTDESAVNLALVGVLLNFEDHILNRHILTPTVRYYAGRYGNKKKLAEAKEGVRSSLAIVREVLGPSSRRLVRDFRATWTLR